MPFASVTTVSVKYFHRISALAPQALASTNNIPRRAGFIADGFPPRAALSQTQSCSEQFALDRLGRLRRRWREGHRLQDLRNIVLRAVDETRDRCGFHLRRFMR